MERSVRKRFLIRLGAAALAAIVFSGTGRASAADPRQSAFRIIAKELLAGIGTASLEDIPAIGGYGKPRIAIAPFRTDKSGIAPELASEFNAWLLAELTRQGSRTYRFVARDTLKSVIRDIDTLNELDSKPDGRVAQLLRNARVDILIVGTLHKDGPAARLSYKAVSVEDGIVFGATQPRWIAVDAPPTMVARRDVAPDLPPANAVDTSFRPARRPVYWAQRMLEALGFNPGPADGIMRPATRRAIGDYQRRIGVAVNGRMTRPLIRELRRSLRDEGKTALALP